MEPAEGPDEKDDRDRYADQPKQKTSTHNFLLLVASQPNVGSELKFHARKAARLVRTLTHEYEETRQAAMQEFAKSWYSPFGTQLRLVSYNRSASFPEGAEPPLCSKGEGSFLDSKCGRRTKMGENAPLKVNL